MTRTYFYQETQKMEGEPIDGRPTMVEKEIWGDDNPSHEALIMYVDDVGYWWAYEKDSGSGKRLTEEEHGEALKSGFSC